MNTLVLDSGGVSLLARQSKDTNTRIRAFLRTGQWPPRVPAVVLVDRCGRIRWRVYGAEASLGALRSAIDDVLASAPSP